MSYALLGRDTAANTMNIRMMPRHHAGGLRAASDGSTCVERMPKKTPAPKQLKAKGSRMGQASRQKNMPVQITQMDSPSRVNAVQAELASNVNASRPMLSPAAKLEMARSLCGMGQAASPSGYSRSVTGTPVASLIFFAKSGLGRRSPLRMRVIVDGFTPSSRARWLGFLPLVAR